MKHMRRPYQHPTGNHLADRAFAPAGDSAWTGFGPSFSDQGLGAKPGGGGRLFFPRTIKLRKTELRLRPAGSLSTPGPQKSPAAAARFTPNRRGRAGFLAAACPSIPRHFGEGV
jgi:hypothetical protein